MANNQAELRTRAGEPTTSPPSRESIRLRPDGASTDSNGMKARLAKRRKSRKRRRLLFLVVCAIAAGGGFAAWQWQPWSDVTPVDTATATTQVVRRDFASSVLATGAVKPEIGAEVRVGSRISGKVVKLRANIGDAVTVGQIIAELEKADLEATVAQRKAEVELAEARLAAVKSLLPKEIEKAEADMRRWQATLTLAEKDVDRASKLVEKRIISEEDYDEFTERFEVAKAQVALSRKTLELSKIKYQEDLRQAVADVARVKSTLINAEVQRSYATLTAPISGVIGSVSTQEGETVAAGLNSPTFVTIIDLRRLQVDAMVDEVDIGKVHPGQKVVFTVDAFPAREFPGKVVAIYPKAVLLENVVYYDVVVNIQGNEDEVLRPDMTASVTVLLDAKTDVPAVPIKAVKRERGKNVVYVVKGGQPQPREVIVGWKDAAWIEIVAGLQEGETILKEAPANKPARL